jgi:hypothetical protein
VREEESFRVCCGSHLRFKSAETSTTVVKPAHLTIRRERAKPVGVHRRNMKLEQANAASNKENRQHQQRE